MPPGSIVPVLALVGILASPEATKGGKAAIDEVIHPWAVAIVDTPTPPTSARRIDVNRWEDLLRAAELLGRPILRLHGGEGGPEGSLFYVADGPQSYVFGFSEEPIPVSRSGAYAPPSPPTVVPVPPEEVAPESDSPSLASPSPSSPAAPPVRPLPPPVVPDPADALLGPETFEEETGVDNDTELPSSTVVERRIREMVHELLADFRKLPPSSDRLERGTEHIQRAVDMLHLSRYGVAQIELNKASRILRDEPDR